MSTLLIVLCLWLTPAASQDGKPRALQEFEQARSAERLRTVRAEILWTEPGTGIAGGTCRSFKSFEAVGANYCVTNRGDEDDVVVSDENGQPKSGFGPLRMFVADDEIWMREERSTFAHVDGLQMLDAYDAFDVRVLGSNPWSYYKDVETFARDSGLKTPTYSERREGDLYVVTADLGEAQAKWWIDPEKDWSVTRTQILTDETVRFEQVFTIAYDKYDRIWFPSKVEEYRRAAGGTAPSRVIEILGVEFNRPEHKPELTPADIGVEPGMHVVYQNHDPVDGGSWDGERVLKSSEFSAKHAAGAIPLGLGTLRLERRSSILYEKMDPDLKARLIEESRSRRIRRSDVAAFENDWEKYTREFIERNKLDADVSQRAWSICGECVDAGKTYAASVLAEIESIDGALAKADDPANPLTPERKEKLTDRRAKLHEPLDRIFDERLVPRLDRLVKTPAKPK